MRLFYAAAHGLDFVAVAGPKKTDPRKEPEFALNAHYYGGSVDPDPRDKAKGWLQAIDPATGKVRWKKEWPTPLVAGVTVTSGNVLFTGDFKRTGLDLVISKDDRELVLQTSQGVVTIPAEKVSAVDESPSPPPPCIPIRAADWLSAHPARLCRKKVLPPHSAHLARFPI